MGLVTTNYLILASLGAANARSEAAYAPLRQTGTMTTRLWTARTNPVDGRRARRTDNACSAGLEMSQAAYDALLDAAERAALIATLPKDWEPLGSEM